MLANNKGVQRKKKAGTTQIKGGAEIKNGGVGTN